MADDPKKKSYPSWRYHATQPARVVNSADEEPEGGGWAESPADLGLEAHAPKNNAPGPMEFSKAKTAPETASTSKAERDRRAADEKAAEDLKAEQAAAAKKAEADEKARVDAAAKAAADKAKK